MQYSPTSIPFNISADTLNKLQLPPKWFATQDDFMENFVFVTALSSDHFEEGSCAIYHVQEFYPDRKLLVYDIGLNETEVSLVSINGLFSNQH